MAHTKIIMPGSQDFGEPVVSLIKKSSRGLLGSDRDALIKRAGAQIAHEINDLSSPEDESLVHLIAMGATEHYGANRNGDGFKQAALRLHHPSFVKHAMFYRSHLNKDRRKSYGIVKRSFYNEPMKRVELIVALNASDAAARRNGGLLANQELEKLASGRELPVSMACRVPLDYCSYCGNAAPSREQYCDSIENGGHCKAGGLKHNICALVDIDGGLHQLHADNRDPTFFDISHVFRPADRIAYVTGQLKAAGHEKISGSELAEMLGVTVPYELLISNKYRGDVQQMLKLAYEMADRESVHRNAPEYQNSQEVALQPLTLGREKFAETVHALAQSGICLPLTQFLQLTLATTLEKAADVAACVQPALGRMFTRLLTRGNFEDRVAENPYVSAGCSSQASQLWAEKHAADFSLKQSHVVKRETRAALHANAALITPQQTTIGTTPAAEKLAEEYALYQLGFLSTVADDRESSRLQDLLVQRNSTIFSLST